MRIVEATAKTRKDAIQKALDKLGCELDEVEIEILDEGSAGFLGIGQRDVHVRVKAPHLSGGVIGEDDEDIIDDNIGNRIDGPPTHQQQRSRVQTRRRGPRGRGGQPMRGGLERRPQPHLVRGPQPMSRGAGGGERQQQRPRPNRDGDQDRGGYQNRDRDRDRPRSGRPHEGGGNRQPRGGGDRRPPRGEGRGNREGRGGRSHRQHEQRRPQQNPAPSRPKPRKERTQPIDKDAAEALGKAAASLLEEILAKMDMPGTVGSSLNEDDNVVLDVTTEHGGMLIGRKGKNLESLQFLINRIFVSGDEKDTVDRILIDIEGYRKRRKEQLEEMARAMAEKVKTTGRALRLKPLDPQERRIVHLALESDPDVRTFSLGNSLHRRVVIAPANESGESAQEPGAIDDATEDIPTDEYDNDPDFKRYGDGDDDSEPVTADNSSGDSDEK